MYNPSLLLHLPCHDVPQQVAVDREQVQVLCFYDSLAGGDRTLHQARELEASSAQAVTAGGEDVRDGERCRGVRQLTGGAGSGHHQVF